MLPFTCLPKNVSNWLQVLRPMFRHRHHLVFCWLLVCQAVYQEKATITGLARIAPRHLAEWHLRRLLTAAYWNTRLLLWWFADHAIAALPPPDDGVCHLVVDSTLKGKTGQKHPLAKKGRLSEYAPYVFGLHIVVVMLQWGNYRIPVDFEIVRRKDHPHYRSENALFRRMLVRFRRPSWAQLVVVVADAAFASKANVQLIQRRGYFFVIAFARTWRFANGQSLKDLVTHLPKKHYRRCWVPLEEPGRRRTYWTYTKRACLHHVGDVTIILSKKRRNDGPKQTKILVTNLPEVTARQVVDVYRRRWSVEVCQTQPVKMTWCPLRRACWTISGLRGTLKREHVGNIHVLPGDDDFPDQALRDGLAFFKGEPVEVVTQQVPKGVGMLNDLLPMPRLLLGAGSLLAFLLDLLHLRGEFQPPRLSCAQADHLSLIRVQ